MIQCVYIYIHIYIYMYNYITICVHYSKTFGANLESVALTSFGTSDGFREVCLSPFPDLLCSTLILLCQFRCYPG